MNLNLFWGHNFPLWFHEVVCLKLHSVCIYSPTDSTCFIMVIYEGGLVGLYSYYECLIIKLYSSPNTIRVMDSRRKVWAWHIAHMGGMRNMRAWLKKSKRKRPVWRYRHNWDNDIGMELKGIGWLYVNRILVAQVRDKWLTPPDIVMNMQVPEKEGNFLTSWVTASFLRSIYVVS